MRLRLVRGAAGGSVGTGVSHAGARRHQEVLSAVKGVIRRHFLLKGCDHVEPSPRSGRPPSPRPHP